MIQAIIDFLTYLFGKLLDLAGWLLDGVVYLLKGVVWFFLDGILTTIHLVVSAIDLSAVVFQWAAAWADIPQVGIYLMVQIGFPQFVLIIASAYTIRFVMNLVPSVAGTGLDKL